MAVSNGKYLRKGHTRETHTLIYTLPAAAHLKNLYIQVLQKKSLRKTFMIKSENKSKIFESSLFWWTNQKATKDTHTPTHTHTSSLNQEISSLRKLTCP